MIATLDGTQEVGSALPAGYVTRSCQSTDVPALGRPYFEAYEPGVAGETLAEAVADIEASFAGAPLVRNAGLQHMGGRWSLRNANAIALSTVLPQSRP